MKEKHITRNLWLGFKNIPSSESELHPHIIDFIGRARNQSWNVHMLGHQEQLRFLETYYPNSSLVWAYQAIHSQVGVSACDLWRYAALYAFGGLYMDDDSDIQTHLEDAIHPDDMLILTQEGNTYHDNCYIPSYHLSGNYLQQHFPGVDSRLLYGNKILANWAIFSAPRHPALLKIMKNAVELLRKEYLREPAIWMLETEPRWKVVMCSTGPSMLTATVRLMTAEHNISVRVLNKDFQDWGGVYKVEDRDGGSYYMNTMNAHNIPILKEYVPFRVERLEGRVIQSAKAMYVVNNGIYANNTNDNINNNDNINTYDYINNVNTNTTNDNINTINTIITTINTNTNLTGTKRLIPNFDTFNAMNFTLFDVVHFYNYSEFLSIPEGAMLPSLDYPRL